MSRFYVGLSCSTHDPSLAIVDTSGEVVFAEALERSTQNKRAWYMVPDDIARIEGWLRRYVDAGSDVVVASTWSRRYRFPSLLMPAVEALYNPSSSDGQLRRIELLTIGKGTAYANAMAGAHLAKLLARRHASSNKSLVRKYYGHHLTHAAHAAYGSPFEDAVCVIVDGYGEWSSVSIYEYKNGRVRPAEGPRRIGAGSLGLLYGRVCEACGFDWRGGEDWKVMGLAAYGKLDEEIYRSLQGIVEIRNCQLILGKDAKKKQQRLAARKRPPGVPPIESADLAYTAQLVFSELYLQLLRDVFELKISKNLVLGGGCALNSAANGLVLERTPFERLHIPSAPADDGNCIGAAKLAYFDDHPNARPRPQVQSPYLGSSLELSGLRRLKDHGHLPCVDLPGSQLYPHVAGLLAAGKIIGWARGRAEFGPRALGNRSILADPRSPAVKDAINSRVKFREEFRPFAPAILMEDGAEYFECFQPSPYMEVALRFKSSVKSKVPGVVHVDGTGRLQTVTREMNEPFYRLISAFKQITGVPLLLNTSFNVMGKPIMHSVEDAVSVFMTTGLDVLVLDDTVFEKPASLNKTTSPALALDRRQGIVA